jgi:hypothetical protein
MLEFLREPRIRRHLQVESLLTLTIAVGGIATGIGAIWAAMVARHQAQFTERSLAQTERSLAEQSQTLREQNERARLSFEMDMLFRLEDRFYTPFLERRRRAANYVKEHFFTDDGELLPIEHMSRNSVEVLNFFEQLGHEVKVEAVHTESVWHRFGWMARRYWALYQPAIDKIRQEEKDPTLWEDFEQLNDLMADLERQHDVAEDITKQQLRRFVEEEALLGMDPPKQEKEHPAKGS